MELAAHAPDVEEPGFAIARGQVHDGAVLRHLVVDRLAVVPFLRHDGHGPIALRKLLVGNHGNAHRRGVADDLGEDADHVVEVGDGAQAAVPPGGVVGAGAHGAAAFALGHQAAVHGGADHFDAERHQRIEVVVERIAEGRDEDHGAGGSGLVVVVHDLRKPLDEQLAVHVGGFLHVGHVEIAIVVVADVLGVESRQAVHGALERVLLAHVPVGDQFLAVGVGLHVEHDDVVEEAHGLFVGAAHHLVDPLHELLRAHGFGGVQSAIDPHDGLAFLGERARFLLADAFGMRQFAGDFLVARELLHVLGRGDDGHPLVAAFFGLADALELHARAFGRELFPVGFQLGVVGDLVIVAEIEPKRFLWRGNFGGRLCGQQASGQGCYNHEPGDSSFCHRCEFILIGVSLPRFSPI